MQLAALVVAADLFGSTSAFAALDSGKTLWDSCNDPNDTAKQSYCLGYVAGVKLGHNGDAVRQGSRSDCFVARSLGCCAMRIGPGRSVTAQTS
jgi:hypothetical protein